MMDPKQREKCLKEVRLLESLDHPNIIKYLDSFIEDNQLFIAIEWAEKGDLKQLIKRSISEDLSIDEKKIWEYLYQIASALKHMQDKRIMHRDLKPANIFLGSDGTLKLGDLGLGRFMSSQTIEAFSRVGTPLYMSPEVLKGQGYDWKSDVWSLGCVIYELACLRSPFKRDDEKMSLYDLFQTISKGEFPPLPPRYSEELRQVVNSMIQIMPQNRLSVDQVVELCEIQLKSIVKKSRIDPYLIMEDIYEKLKLLNYESRFCKAANRNPLVMVYFAHEINKTEQLRYFYDVSVWIMSLKTPKQAPLYSSSKSNLDKMIENLMNEIKNFGVKIPEFVSYESLKNGFGEAVCFIVNDLLNKELIRQDYSFKAPILIENGVECYGEPPEEIAFYEEIESGVEFRLEVHEELSEESSPDIENPTELEESYINPEDWLAETERVSKKLVLPIGEETTETLGQLSEVRKLISTCSSEDTLNILERKSKEIAESLERIQFLEKKLNKENLEEIQRLQQIMLEKNTLVQKCSEKRQRFDNLLKQSESLASRQEEIQTLNNNPVDAMKKQLSFLKLSISSLKKELFQIEIQTAISRSILDHYSIKKI